MLDLLTHEKLRRFVIKHVLPRQYIDFQLAIRKWKLPDAFARAGYEAFNQMLKPVFGDPSRFTQDLTRGSEQFHGKLMLLSSECSFVGYAFQEQFHMPFMPRQTVHVKAPMMGHNMLTLNPAWSVALISDFLQDLR